MRSTKGLSQILYLIIAASVLMIAALSLIFMLQTGLPDGESDARACIATVENQCELTGGSGTISEPSSCTLEDDQTPRENLPSTWVGQISGSGTEIQCSAVNN